MKVYLKYPWRVPDSSYYKSIVSHPPPGIDFINVKKEDFVGINASKQFKGMFVLKKEIRKILTAVKIPNLVKVKENGFDIIHCCHCLSQNKSPWIVDTESYWNLSATSDISYSKRGKKIIKNLLKSEYCKKILPWTETAKKDIIEAMDDKEIEEKIELLPYAIPMPNFNIGNLLDKLTFLFIGRYFKEKGGLTALKVFEELLKKYDIRVIIVSPVPDAIKSQFTLFKNPNVKVYNLMTQEKLMAEIYPKADVFLYPGYSDSFGFMMVEAMSFGIPIITVDGYARRDIVTDSITGNIIQREVIQFQGVPNEEEEKEIVKKLIEKSSFLIENPNVIKEMAFNCIKEVSEGKFSLLNRNKKLKKIYEESAE